MVQSIYQHRFCNNSTSNLDGILSDICAFSKNKIAVATLDEDSYYSTENMLPKKAGATSATSLPTISLTTACHIGDTLISNIRPYFKKIVYCYEECGCSTDVLCFVPSQLQYAAFLFSTLYSDNFFNFMVAGSKGTKMPRGDKQQIMSYPIVIPSTNDIDAFNAVALPILEQIKCNRCENKRLVELRDTLLPKPMSGKLDVSKIDI